MSVALTDEMNKVVNLTIHRITECSRGFAQLATANGYGSYTEIYAFQLVWQHFQFYQWTISAGPLLNPPTLKITNVTRIEDVLLELQQVLTDVTTQRDEFGLVFEDTDEHIDVNYRSSIFLDGLQLPLGETNGFLVTDGDCRRSSLLLLTRTKCRKVDRTGFQRLLKEIHSLINDLKSQLSPTELHQNEASQAHLLRAFIAQSINQPLLKLVECGLNVADEALIAAAHLKQKSVDYAILDTSILQLSTQRGQGSCYGSVNISGSASANLGNTISIHKHFHFHGDDSLRSADHTQRSQRSADATIPRITQSRLQTSNTNRTLKLDYSKLSGLQSAVTLNERQVATYDGKPVLVEWKTMPVNLERRLWRRVVALTELLSTMSNPAFHALPCAGFLKLSGSSVLGFVFFIPGSRNTVTTLRELLQVQSFKPSLNEKLRLGKEIVESVLQLHTSGWLHKSINAENVFFLDQDSSRKTGRSTSPLFLGGYKFSRLDNPSETTEDAHIQDVNSLYRHPLSLSEDRYPYCKSFDLYSLGCLLLEIGSWQSLQAIIHRSTKVLENLPVSSAQKFSSRDWQSILEQKETLLTELATNSLGKSLKNLMGERFASIVARCISSFEHITADQDGDDPSFDDTEITLSLLVQVLAELESILEAV